MRQEIAATINVTKGCLYKQYSENKIIYTGKLNFKRVFHSKMRRVVVPKQGGTLFCITKRKKHLKENIKPHFILRILIQMSLSLLSLFSIKKSHSFATLNFINESIIHGAAYEIAHVTVSTWRPAWFPQTCDPATPVCAFQINHWSPAWVASLFNLV